jgi:ABC-type bacteriocin/lantibiotic exporter with double-glycine peptidase domain
MEIEKNIALRKVLRRLLALEDRIKGVAFPGMKRVRQIDVYSCGPAVISALFSFLGVKVSQRKVITSLRVKNKIKEYGLNIKDLARASRMIGKGAFSFWKKSNGKVSDLDAVVNKYKWPVGVDWWGVFYEDEDEDNGHYVIITAVDKKAGYLRMADPFSKFAGIDRRFRIRDFEKRWWDENVIKISGTSKKRTITDRKMMFVITGKGETWPKKLGMKKG